MGLGSIILGIFSFLLMICGVIFVFVPFLGTMLSFLSPILAIAGVILGGVAMSRAKQGMGESEGLATAGLVLNIIAFVPAMLVALTCGLCNTMCTGAFLNPTPPGSTQSVPWDRDGGPGSNPFEDLFDPPDAAVPDPVAPDPDPNTPPVPMQRQGDETPLPPPPLPPGPAGSRAAPPPTPPATTDPSAADPPTGVTTDPPPDPAPESGSARRRRRASP
jgi:hypothetical protein